MRKNTWLFILLLLVLAILGGIFRLVFIPQYNASQLQKSSFVTASPAASAVPEAISTNSRISQLVAALSPEQQIAQLIALPVVIDNTLGSSTSQATSAAVITTAELQPGAVTVFGSKISSSSAKIAIQKLKKVSPQTLILVDHEGGTVQRLNGQGFTNLPSWNQACKLNSEEQMNLFNKSAQELKVAGIEGVLAPVVDVAASTSALKWRACDNPVTTTQTAQNFITAFTNQRILTVLKHYPGIGQSTQDLHQHFDQATTDPAQQKIFQDLLKNSSLTEVMTSHLGNSQDPTQLPCSANKNCLDSLRQLNSNVIIFSDALEMSSATHSATLQPKDLGQVSRQAIQAGNTMLIFGPTVTSDQLKTVIETLLKEYNNSPEFRKIVQQNVERIVQQKMLRESKP